MVKNLKFVVLISLLFLISCGSQINSKHRDFKKEVSYKSSDLKYNYAYYKIVVELLLHKGRIDEAINIFTSNIAYFDNETDLMNMINRARELNKFDSIMTIVNRWIELDNQNIYAHKAHIKKYKL